MIKDNKQFGVLFTLDYEIHGNGEGSPRNLMLEPTDRMLRLFDQYGAKLTIMADVGEILKFKEYMEETGEDKFHFQEIKAQLQKAILGGHDVQLHMHSSYFKSVYKNNSWNQYWPEYSMADLPIERLNELISIGKKFLENMIREVKPDYECFVFRAANWSMVPSTNILRALKQNQILIDTSIFKFGQRNGRVTFDYTDAFSELLPWPASEDNVCNIDKDSTLLEVPIYCEQHHILNFITANRLYRVFQASFHKHPKSNASEVPNDSAQSIGIVSKLKSLLLEKHALKMDFNQCTGKQLTNMMKRIERKFGALNYQIPVVGLGHSKIFTKANENSLAGFLKYVTRSENSCFFAVFNDFKLDELKEIASSR